MFFMKSDLRRPRYRSNLTSEGQLVKNGIDFLIVFEVSYFGETPEKPAKLPVF
jgi:hypothetical protein